MFHNLYRNLIGVSASALLAVVLAGSASMPVSAGPAAGIVPLLSIHQGHFTNCMREFDHSRIGETSVESYVIGLGGAEAATMQFELNGKFDMFESMVGFSSTAPDSRMCTFELWADGKLITKVGPLKASDKPDLLRGKVKSEKNITLRMVPEKYNGTAGAMWGEPKLFTGTAGAELEKNLIVHVNGELYKMTPQKVGGGRQISIPIVVKPGVNEYKVTSNYDESSGRLDVNYSTEGVVLEEPMKAPDEY